MRIKKNLIFQLIFLSFFSSQIEARESVDSLNLLKSDESQTENKLSGLKFKGIPLKEFDFSNYDFEGSETEDKDEGEKSSSILPDALPAWSPGKLDCYVCDYPHCDDQNEFGEAYIHISRGCLRCYVAHVRDIDGLERKSKGCVRDLPHQTFYCSTPSYDGRHQHKLNGESAQYAFECCKGNLCNNHTVWPELPPVPDITSLTGGNDSEDGVSSSFSNSVLILILAVVIPVFVFVVFLLLCVFFMRKGHVKRMNELGRIGEDFLHQQNRSSSEFIGLRAQPVGDSTLRELRDHDGSWTSGSGSGMPFLVQRTLAKQIQLGGCIGKGRYGEVWHGVWNGDSVAVKIFYSRDEASWKRETDIYSTVLLRHDNILGYIGSDFTSLNSCTQLWLVTHYHPKGSLYDFLNRESEGEIDPSAGLKMMLTALNGLVHLHTEIHGTQGKPGIAHRDIKSKNILVRLDGSCVVADFGLAVTHKNSTDELVIPENTRVGTKRYMSPEVLDFSINKKTTFEAFRLADMYSFSLVMWEILRRVEMEQPDIDEKRLLASANPTSSFDNSYALPYFSDVGPDPGFDEMKQIVCIEKRRPVLYERWNYHPITSGIAKLMSECWHSDPNVRLSALRLKKSLATLSSMQLEFVKFGGDSSRFRDSSRTDSGRGTVAGGSSVLFNGSSSFTTSTAVTNFSPSGTMS